MDQFSLHLFLVVIALTVVQFAIFSPIFFWVKLV